MTCGSAVRFAISGLVFVLERFVWSTTKQAAHSSERCMETGRTGLCGSVD